MKKAILFDVEGVLYQEAAALPGAAEVLAWCDRERIPHLFITNTTSVTRAQLSARLAEMGLQVPAERLLTPAAAAARWLRARGVGPCALFVTEAARAEFADLPQSESAPRAVVVGDLGEAWDFATLNRAFRLLMADPPPLLLALGATRYWRAEDGLRLDLGPFVAALEYASGARAVVLGKPEADYYRLALQWLGVAAAQTVMIGDDVRNDVEPAQRLGMQGVLVRTGKFTPRDLQRGIAPDALLDSVAKLPAWWSSMADQ